MVKSADIPKHRRAYRLASGDSKFVPHDAAEASAMLTYHIGKVIARGRITGNFQGRAVGKCQSCNCTWNGGTGRVVKPSWGASAVSVLLKRNVGEQLIVSGVCIV